MRKGMEPDFIENDEGEIIGINLSSDACAEHEWGIDGIKDTLGIPSKKDITEENVKGMLGIKNRTMTIFDEKMFFFEEKEKHSCLTLKPWAFKELLGWENYELKSNPEKLATAWNGKRFGVVVENHYQTFLSELYEAFKRKDVAIWIGGGHALFENPGLLILIASRIPKEITTKMYNADMSYYRLEEKVKATKIREILEKAEKAYYALSPEWKDKNEKEIRFWLNPQDQANDNCGWFTLEDLMAWSKNEGPIPIKQE